MHLQPEVASLFGYWPWSGSRHHTAKRKGGSECLRMRLRWWSIDQAKTGAYHLTQSSQWPSLIGSGVSIQKSVLSIWTWLNSLKCSRATDSLVFLCSGRWAVLMESPKTTCACTAWPNLKHVINQIPYCHCPSYPAKGLNNQLRSAWWHFTLWHSIKPWRFTSIRRVN